MTRVAVLGVGSPFGADQLGWRAVDVLEHSLPVQLPGITFEWQRLDRPGPALLNAMDGADAVLVIDAVMGLPDGTPIRPLALDEPLAGDGISAHGFGVADALRLGEVLGMPPVGLIGIRAESWPAVPEEPLRSEAANVIEGLLAR